MGWFIYVMTIPDGRQVNIGIEFNTENGQLRCIHMYDLFKIMNKTWEDFIYTVIARFHNIETSHMYKSFNYADAQIMIDYCIGFRGYCTFFNTYYSFNDYFDIYCGNNNVQLYLFTEILCNSEMIFNKIVKGEKKKYRYAPAGLIYHDINAYPVNCSTCTYGHLCNECGIIDGGKCKYRMKIIDSAGINLRELKKYNLFVKIIEHRDNTIVTNKNITYIIKLIEYNERNSRNIILKEELESFKIYVSARTEFMNYLENITKDIRESYDKYEALSNNTFSEYLLYLQYLKSLSDDMKESYVKFSEIILLINENVSNITKQSSYKLIMEYGKIIQYCSEEYEMEADYLYEIYCMTKDESVHIHTILMSEKSERREIVNRMLRQLIPKY